MKSFSFKLFFFLFTLLSCGTPPLFKYGKRNPAQSSQEQTGIYYQEYSEAVKGLSEKESSQLKDIYDNYKVLDLERTNLFHLKDWLDEVNIRLTNAIEEEGFQYPEYRISVLASEEPVAFILKHQVAGQKTYRGHVYFSSALIDKMIDTLGASLESISDRDLRTLLDGLQGILAHEFTHPKEDELVKWDWRQGQGSSFSNHGQADEMMTDLTSIKISKKAKLEPSGLFTGLQLLIGNKPDQNGIIIQSLSAGVSTHPDNALRLNIIRTALTRQRLNEGATNINNIPFSKAGMASDLHQLLSLTSLTDILKNHLYRLGGNPYINVLEEIKECVSVTDVRKSYANFPKTIAYLQILQEIEKQKNFLFTDLEIEAFKNFIIHMKNVGLKSPFIRSSWSIGITAIGSFDITDLKQSRRLQREFGKIKSFDDSRLTPFINAELESFKENPFKDPNYNLTSLSFFLPQKYTFKIIDQFISDPYQMKLSPALQMRFLLLSWRQSLSLGRNDFDREQLIIQKILSLMDNKSAATAFYNEKNNILYRLENEKIYNERLSILKKTDFQKMKTHLSLYAEIQRLILENNPTFYLQSDWKIIFWDHEPDQVFRSFLGKDNSLHPKTFDYLFSLFSGELFTKILINVRSAVTAKKFHSRTESLTLFELKDLVGDNSPFTLDQKILLYNGLLLLDQPDTSLKYLSYYTAFLKNHADINKDSSDLLIAVFKKFRERGVSPTELLEKIDFFSALSNSSHKYFHFIKKLKDEKVITPEEFVNLINTQILPSAPTIINERLYSFEISSANHFANLMRQGGDEGINLLQKIVSQYDLQKIINYDEADHIKNSRTAGATIHPKYAVFLSMIKESLGSDFKKMLGISTRIGPETVDFQNAFIKNYSQAKNFLQLIFNPDGVKIPIHLKGLVQYNSLDDLAKIFSNFIPTSGLSFEQYQELWYLMATKRSNRYTDQIFIKHIYPNISHLDHSQKMATYFDILNHGLVKSEKYKNILMEDFLLDDILKLKAMEKIKDDKLLSITRKIMTYVPDSSRFRDDLLERMAWKLELDEKATLKFIEPMKSFNYKSIDLGAINLLSTVSALMSKLKNQEKLNFVTYIQEPNGELLQIVPGLKDVIQSVINYLTKNGMKPDKSVMQDIISRLEVFTRDASEGEKLLLIEMLVGSKSFGLWFQAEEWKEKLYQAAGLKEEELILFKSYVKTLPAYEHSIALSFLLASRDSEKEDDTLLKILELHKTTGIKFAQMASVLSIFGEEQSQLLKKAKDASAPATRSEIFELLHQVYSPKEFDEIKTLKQMGGSGSIKHVVFVEYKNGTTEAVYLKRPFLEETIENTLSIAENFVKNLNQDPQYKNAYDYDFYLKTLKEQLSQEINFPRELKLSQEMANQYKKVPAIKGWSFDSVPPSTIHKQTESVLHYRAIENAQSFDDLNPEDKKIAAELIIKTELKFIFDLGIFDADRHLGNFLFNSQVRKIYAIDFGQVYYLTPDTLMKPGDRYYLANILYGLSDQNKNKGAQLLAKTFIDISLKNELIKIDSKKLEQDFFEILKSEKGMQDKLQQFLGVLTKHKIRLPLIFSMGILKGLMIVLNEDYAKLLGDKYLEKIITDYVTKELILGQRFKITEGIKNLVQKKLPCSQILDQLKN